MPSIQILSKPLINQIAAGEIIERPASVVKELLENSLDAGANQIDIYIKKGGTQLIRVKDNGYGINKKELILALTNHATSKVAVLDDFNFLATFGFRGEALASINSVSRVKIISRTARQKEAWSLYVEGSDITTLKLKPISHPVGTTLEIWDIFYNIPVRRRFLKTEKTEFIHIEKVVRCIALARFTVTIKLFHNDKLVRQYRSINNTDKGDRRIAAIFGKQFMSHVLTIDVIFKYMDIKLNGWLVVKNINSNLRIDTEVQYFYVNERIIKNKLINNAIRRAYENILGNEYPPIYILYLKINPLHIEVNIHPTKNDIRFKNHSRLIHDYIYEEIINILTKYKSEKISIQNISSLKIEYPKKNEVITKKLIKKIKPENYEINKYINYNRVLTILHNDIAVIEDKLGLGIISLSRINIFLIKAQLEPGVKGLKPHPLLIPLKFKLTKIERKMIKNHVLLFKKMGMNLLIDYYYVILRTVPSPLRQQNLNKLIPELFNYLSQQTEISISRIRDYITQNLDIPINWNISQAIELLSETAKICPNLFISPPGDLLQRINLEPGLNILKRKS
ncbi:MAG: DNA mismatch repair endonuclease MutL [Candidatus Dasytiphilus stammeri]